MTVATLLVVLAAGAPASQSLAAAGLLDDRAPATVQQVTVRPGETLWAIATRTAPEVDPRQTVAVLMDLNGLETSTVQAGQVLRLPGLR